MLLERLLEVELGRGQLGCSTGGERRVVHGHECRGHHLESWVDVSRHLGDEATSTRESSLLGQERRTREIGCRPDEAVLGRILLLILRRKRRDRRDGWRGGTLLETPAEACGLVLEKAGLRLKSRLLGLLVPLDWLCRVSSLLGSQTKRALLRKLGVLGRVLLVELGVLLVVPTHKTGLDWVLVAGLWLALAPLRHCSRGGKLM